MIKKRRVKKILLLCICLVWSCVQTGPYQVLAAGSASVSYDISADAVNLTNTNETVSITGTSIEQNTIVISGGQPTLQLSNVIIQAPNKDATPGANNSETSKPAVHIKDGAQVTIEVSGTNELAGGAYRAGIQVEEGASVTIAGSGSLNVSTAGIQGSSAAGIGGGSVYNSENGGNYGEPAGRIVIGGSVKLTATCGWGSAAIGAANYVGSGQVESASLGFESITLKDQAEVTTVEPGYSAAIGSGYQNSTDIYQYYKNGVGELTIQDEAKLTLNGTGTNGNATCFATESIVAQINYQGGTITSGTYSSTKVSPVKKTLQFIGDQGAFLRDTHITYKVSQRYEDSNIKTLYNTVTGEGTVGGDGKLQDITVFNGSNYIEAVTDSGTIYRAVFGQGDAVIAFHPCTCPQLLKLSMEDQINVPFTHNGSYGFNTYDKPIQFNIDAGCALEDYLHVEGEVEITSPDMTITRVGDGGLYYYEIPEASMNKTAQIAVSANVNGREFKLNHSIAVVKKAAPQVESMTVDIKGEVESEEVFTITLTGTQMEVFQKGTLIAVMADPQSNVMSQAIFKRVNDNQWRASLKALMNRTDQTQTYRVSIFALSEDRDGYNYDFRANAFVDSGSADQDNCMTPVSVKPDLETPAFSLKNGALKISKNADGTIQVEQPGRGTVTLLQKKLAISEGTTLDSWKVLYGDEDYKTQPLVEIEEGAEVEIVLDGDVLQRLPGYTANAIEGQDNVVLKLDTAATSTITGDIHLGDNSVLKAGVVTVEGDVTADQVKVETSGILIVRNTLTARKMITDQAVVYADSLKAGDFAVFNESFVYFQDISGSVLPTLNHSIFGVAKGFTGVLKDSDNQTLKKTDISLPLLMSHGDYPFPALKEVIFSADQGENWHAADLSEKNVSYDIFNNLFMTDTPVLYVQDDVFDVLVKIADKIYQYDIDGKAFTGEVILHLDKNELSFQGTMPQAELGLQNKGTVDLSYVNCQLSGQDADKMQILEKAKRSKMMNIAAGDQKNTVVGLKEGMKGGTYKAEMVVSIGDLNLYKIPVTLTKQDKKPGTTDPPGGTDGQPDTNVDHQTDKQSGLGSAGNPTGGNVKSGDTAPVGLCIGTLAAAIAVIGGVFWHIKKKGKR